MKSRVDHLLRVVCTTARDKAETALMRTYDHPNNHVFSATNKIMQKHYDKITISVATTATSAAPTYFPEVVWPQGEKETLTFWDGGLLNNNPIDQLWYSRYDLVGPGEPEPKVSCVISLGTGWSRADSPSDSWFKLTGILSTVVAFSTNTTAKAQDFSRHVRMLYQRPEHAGIHYFRLNPSLGKDKIGLADYHQMEVLKSLARDFVNGLMGGELLSKVVDVICPPETSSE